jgi:hypothetical protein
MWSIGREEKAANKASGWIYSVTAVHMRLSKTMGTRTAPDLLADLLTNFGRLDGGALL